MTDRDGNDYSHFMITPRFSYKVDGEPVHYGDTIILRSVQLPSYSIHASEIPLLPNYLPPKSRDKDVTEANLSCDAGTIKSFGL